MSLTFDEKALQALYIMEKTNDNLFLTGKAWTGKSTLLRSFIANTTKNIAVLAPTGVAALNIEGSTIHSFFKIPPTITEKNVKKAATWMIDDPKFTELDAIVIDEISMVRADLFDCVNLYMQTVCQNKKPFGGKQMIMIGDLYQLPPVVTSTEKRFFEDQYASPYFFSSKVVTKEKFSFTFHELDTVYRQKDQNFLKLLNGIRTKNLTDPMLNLLNEQVVDEGDREIAPGEMYLAGRNDKVNEINEIMLGKLTGKIMNFKAKARGAMKESAYPTDENLRLKIWAQVMFVVNESTGRRVNGTLGTVVRFEKTEEGLFSDWKETDKVQIKPKKKKEKANKRQIIVQIFGGEEVEVSPYTRRVSQYTYNPEKRKLDAETIGSFTQMPLKLARACTIHKSQGKTFEKVVIDLKWGSFAHGQTYVALSRCKSLKGLKLIAPLEKHHILLDWQIVEFFTQYQNQQNKEEIETMDITTLLKRAIKQKQNLEIVYLRSEDQKSKRIITPKKVGTMEYQGKEFEGLEAFCHSMQEIRVFSVRKILSVEVVE